MKKSFFNNIIFRLLFPPFYGSLVYIMILLVFDSIDQLLNNFFSQEIALCIILTYILSESQRIGFFMLNRIYPLDRNLIIRILWQMLYGLISSCLLISLCLYIYFVWIKGFSSFRLELFTFNIIYGISSIFFNLIYFSIFLFNRRNEEELSKEEKMKNNLEYKMMALKNDVNPEFLYKSLESLITILHKKPEEAENFIERFSDIYRYKISHRNSDLGKLGKEINIINDFVFLSAYRFSGNISIKTDLKQNLLEKNLIPGSLFVLIEDIVKRSSISFIQPLNFIFYSEDENYLSIKYDNNKRLDPLMNDGEGLDNLKKAYSFYTDKPVELIRNGEFEIVKVPLLTVDI
ncbi:histidine kinase [Bacteroidota bacterium]